MGLQEELRLGNLDAKRDWGYAQDYVRAMWMMLQQDEPVDFVISSGENHSVREFCEIAFSHVGLNWEDHVVSDPKFYRPAEVNVLLGDYSKARKMLGWKPEFSFDAMVKLMVDADLQLVKAQIASRRPI
jgi:GDPmannose 4,6-dehydratase